MLIPFLLTFREVILTLAWEPAIILRPLAWEPAIILRPPA